MGQLVLGPGSSIAILKVLSQPGRSISDPGIEFPSHMFGVSAMYENLAQVYAQMGDYSSAVDCLLKSIEIKKENNLPRVFNIYIKLASLQNILKTDKVDYYIGLARQELQSMVFIVSNVRNSLS